MTSGPVLKIFPHCGREDLVSAIMIVDAEGLGRTEMVTTNRAPKLSSSPARGRGGDQVQSLMRALQLLNKIAEGPDSGASLTDLAQQAGLPISTAHRLLTTLEQERYVRFNHEQRNWMIGVQAFVAGCTFTKTRSLTTLARPHMRHLMEEGGETVNLAVEDDGQAVYLAQVECRQIMRVFARPGTRVPLQCSGVGKALLSATSDKRIAQILQERGMSSLTTKSITSPLVLAEELARVRLAGYAVDDEEHAIGLRCIAAPIFDETGDVVAAVSAAGPTARIGEKRIEELGALVVEASRAISADMGARRQ